MVSPFHGQSSLSPGEGRCQGRAGQDLHRGCARRPTVTGDRLQLCSLWEHVITAQLSPQSPQQTPALEPGAPFLHLWKRPAAPRLGWGVCPCLAPPRPLPTECRPPPPLHPEQAGSGWRGAGGGRARRGRAWGLPTLRAQLVSCSPPALEGGGSARVRGQARVTTEGGSAQC